MNAMENLAPNYVTTYDLSSEAPGTTSFDFSETINTIGLVRCVKFWSAICAILTT